MIVNYSKYIIFLDFKIHWHLSHLFSFLFSTLGASFFYRPVTRLSRAVLREMFRETLCQGKLLFLIVQPGGSHVKVVCLGLIWLFQLNNLLYQRTNGNQMNKSCQAFKNHVKHSKHVAYIRQFNIFLFLSMATLVFIPRSPLLERSMKTFSTTQQHTQECWDMRLRNSGLSYRIELLGAVQ